jgi:predicted component of type VI protein secretion system
VTEIPPIKMTQLEAGAAVRTIELAELPVILGRQPIRGIAIVHATISREHARLFEAGGALTVADLNSSNGTFVNGERVTRRTLRPGDVLRLGEIELRYEAAPAAPHSTHAPQAPMDRAKPAAATGVPSAAELFGDDDDGGIRLDDSHVGSGSGAPGFPGHGDPTSTIIQRPSPLFAGPTGPAAPPSSVYRDAAPRPLDPARKGTVLTADLAQQSGLRRLLTVFVAIALAAAIFLGVMKLTEEVAPEGPPPGAVPIDPQDDALDEDR